MNANFYFEQDPWQRAHSCIKNQELGEVYQVSAQCVCEKGTGRAKLEEWEKRVSELVGEKQRGDVLVADTALSFIGVFGNNVVTRFFIDESADGFCENFEIVTDKSLIIWKPGSVTQGYMFSDDECFIEISQQNTVDLEEVK